MSPLSGDPVKRGNQLANLRPGAGAGDGGLQRARSHGAYAVLKRERVEQKTREVYDALAADAPLRDGNGELPRADAAQVALLAECLCRLEDVSANIRDCGVFEQRGRRKGQLRPVVDFERALRREASGYLQELGMTPKSRAALGVDLAATVDLARTWASAEGGGEGV
jgi:hypothetical protein